ncbi:MAG: hydrogenase maturation nickel metallochaperone HypA [Anaerovoracaceae bacterium]|jgi:hydrogenase nickel incorporation protein HypA/HybF
MHEYPITEQIVKMAEEHCREAGASAVRKVNLVCGDYSGFVPESIHMYFDLIAEGTLCDGAEIEIRRVRPKMRCPSCGKLFVRRPLSFACPDCGVDGEPTDIGKEFYIDSIEVE